MLNSRVVPVFVIAAAVATAATACSSSGTTGPAQAGAATTAGSGDAGGSAQAITLLAKMTAPQAVAASTKAVASKKSAKMHLSLKSPVMSETADGAVSFAPAAVDAKLSMSSSNAQAAPMLSQMGQMEMRMSGTVAYINIGGNQQMRDALQGKQWMKIDFGNVAGVPGLSSFSFMKDLGKNNDPSNQLKALLASPDLKKVGQEDHNGVQTLHFSGSLSPQDTLKSTAAGSGLTQQDLDSMTATMKQAGITSTDYDVWVDGNGLPVELKFSEDTSVGTVSGDITYSDWGTPVSVTPPPADQTVDIAQLVKDQQNQQG